MCGCELRKSTLRNARKGTFLAESAWAEKILFNMEVAEFHSRTLIALHNWFVEQQTCSKIGFIPECLILCCRDWSLDTHIKANYLSAFSFDSRPSSYQPIKWFVRNHLVGGFANSNERKFCNAKFLTFGDEVFVVATKVIKIGEEVFMHYKIR